MNEVTEDLPRTLPKTLMALAFVASLSVVLAWPVLQARDSSRPPVTVLPSLRQVPGGPRYEVVSGTFGADWDEQYAGKTWGLLAWGEGETTCWQLAVGSDPEKREGLSCSTPSKDAPEEVAFGSSISFQTGGNDPEEFMFVGGYVGADVSGLEFRRDDGRIVAFDVHDAPPKAGLTQRFYTIVLPYFDYGDLVALEAEGDVLETHHLCGPGCLADREAEEQAKIEAYEQTPVTMEAKAGVFAIAAVGQVGLIDHFGIYYDYKGLGLVDGSYEASFSVSACAPPAGTEGTYRCQMSGEASMGLSQRSGRFVVSDVTGPMTEEQRRKLVGYSEEISSDTLGWRVVATSIARNSGREGWGIGFVLAWTGNIPPPVHEYGSSCTYRVYGSDGKLLDKSRSLPFIVSSEEEERDSGPISEVEEKGSIPEEIDVFCEEPGNDPFDS